MDRMARRITGSLVLLLVAGGLATADATWSRAGRAPARRRRRSTVGRQDIRELLSRSLAAGRTCDQGVRDAKASVALSKTRSAVLAVCDAATATGLGFVTNGDLSIRLAGTAAGEGRQATDGAYGRDATVMNETLARCAKVLATQSAKAAPFLVKTLAPGITTCAP